MDKQEQNHETEGNKIHLACIIYIRQEQAHWFFIHNTHFEIHNVPSDRWETLNETEPVLQNVSPC